VFAALYDTFHAFRHAKRAVGIVALGITTPKYFAALTSAGEEYDALRMKLLTAGGRAPNVLICVVFRSLRLNTASTRNANANKPHLRGLLITGN
jgi:hypothetical protein